MQRLDLGLIQKQVAEQIGVSEASIWNWECHESSPTARDIPAIIQFLGYNPLPAPTTLAEKLLAYRRAQGFTQRAMAKRLGIDPVTLSRIERGNSHRLFAKTRKKLGRL
jgi:transcriptional regulator with XRE-family HTH domain